MFMSFQTVIGPVAAALLLLVPSHVQAQPPSPPSQEPPPAQDPLPPPPDDGPKPAGVGSSAPPKATEDEDAEGERGAADTGEPLPAGTFPGYIDLTTGQPSRPFSGLFSGAGPVTFEKHSLSLSGSLFGGYSTNVAPPGFDPEANQVTSQASQLVGGNGSIDYIRNWRKAAFSAYANGSRTWVEAYEDGGNPWVSRWEVGTSGGFATDLSRRLRFGASGSMSYSPYVRFNTIDFRAGSIASLPGDTAGLDNVLGRDPSIASSGTATLSYALGRKSSLEGYYSAVSQNFVAADPENFDRLDQVVGGRYRYRFNRFVAMRAGYGYRRASFGDPDSAPFTNHVIDVGADAGRSFALTRRTTFSFGTDSSVFVDEGAGGDGADSAARTRVFVGGTADLTHRMGHSWAARAGYRRTVDYQVGFDEPFLGDTAFGSVSGLITSRLDVVTTASYTSGSVGFSGGDNGYSTASAVASVRFAVSRHLATYAEYFYYHYGFGQSVTLPGYLAPRLDRQGVTVGLTGLLPLIGGRR